MRLLPYIAFFLFCGVVSAQPTNVTIIVTTNNFFDLNPSRDAISAVAGNIRLRHTVTDGVDGYDVSAGLPISMTIVSREDGWTNAVVNTVTNDGIGVVWWVLPPLGAGSYRLQSTLVIPGDQFPIYDRYLTVTSAPAASAATVNLTVTNNISADVILTNNISVNATSVVNLTSITTNDITVNATSQVSVTSIQTNNITVNTYVTNVTQSTVYTSGVSSISLTGAVDGAITFAGSGVTQTGSVFNFSGGGGSGNITIEGVTTNVFDFVGQFPVTVSNIGNTIYFGQLGGGGTFIPAGTSNQVFNFVSATNQTFTIPAGVTQIYAYAWGAGGGAGSGSAGAAGGYSFGYFNVTNGEVLTIQIGQGGFISSTTTATTVATNTLNPWPNGGFGASRHTSRAGAGGGSTAILRGTNYLIVAGGGGGTGTSSSGGLGGGDSGSAGTLGTAIAAGGGGTQSAGGSTGSTAIPLLYTNTAGSFYLGGNAGLTTNNTAAVGAGGGGGGWYGGGGGLTSVNNAGGGGGSGYINTSQGVQGTTVRGNVAIPAGQDDPLYGSPSSATWGVGGISAAAGSNGGLILRWVAP